MHLSFGPAVIILQKAMRDPERAGGGVGRAFLIRKVPLLFQKGPFLF
jgi:hypothetical protein